MSSDWGLIISDTTGRQPRQNQVDVTVKSVIWFYFVSDDKFKDV